MSTPKQPRLAPAKARPHPVTSDNYITSPKDVWWPLDGVPGYLISPDGRIAREIKVRTNKNGTQWARVSIKGKQHVIRV